MTQLLAPPARSGAPSRPRRRAGLAGGLVLAGLLLCSPPASADPKDDARRHFVAGLEAARGGDYHTALQEFLAAQAAYPHPATLYNIARAYTDLGDLPAAIETYRLFREADPSRAADVDPVIAVLEARLRQQRAPEPAPSALPAGAATAGEVERLRAIAAELAALGESLSTRGTAEAPAAPAPGAAPPAADAAPDAPPAGDFRDDAYARVVVTASRFGQDPLDSPSSVSILTAEDIRLSGAATVPDLLRRVVGVDVMSLSAAQPDLSIRGFNREMSNKVLVLVDGRSVYADIMMTPLWGTLPIAMEEIDRIEVIRGPGSAVYGANAVTGVINIITRTPGEPLRLVTAHGGSPQVRGGTALVSGREGETAWRFSAGHQRLGRWSREAPVVPGGPVVSNGGDESLSLDVVRANGRVDRRFGAKGVFSLSGGYAGGQTEFYVFGALGDYALPFHAGNARVDLAWGGLHLRAFHNTLRAEAAPWLEARGARSLDTTVRNDATDVELESLQEFDTGAVHHTVNFGGGYRHKLVEWTYLEGGGTPIVEHHFNAFAQEQARVGPVTAIAALRLDRHPLVPLRHTFAPRGALVARVAERTAVRGSVGTSYRVPSQMESYVDLNQLTDFDAVYVRTRGDRSLLPERVLNAELGVHDESSAVHRADVAVFYNRVSDLIYVTDVVPEVRFYDPAQNGFAAGTTRFGNLDPVYDAVGAEADAALFPVDGLDLFANAAVQRVTEDFGGRSVVDGSAPLLRLNGGAAWRSPGPFDLSAQVHYVSAQTWRLREFDEAGALVVREEAVPARTLASVRLGARLLEDDALELSFTAWNLLALAQGEGFREHPKGQLVGPRLTGGATWRF